MQGVKFCALAMVLSISVSGCGVEAMSAAATAASAKQQEAAQGKRTLEAVRGQLDRAQELARSKSGQGAS